MLRYIFLSFVFCILSSGCSTSENNSRGYVISQSQVDEDDLSSKEQHQ